MDQLRAAGAWLKKHHFWVLTVILSLVAVACWWSGARTLFNEFKTNKSTIDGAFAAQQTLRNTPFHANTTVNDRQQSENIKQQEIVNELWKQLYERQRAEVLKWPSNLSAQFHRNVEKLKFGDNIAVDLRNHYNNYIEQHFPELPKIVGARKMDANSQNAYGGRYGGRGGRMGGRGEYGGEGYEGAGTDPAAEEEEDFIVEWLDQQRVRDEMVMPTTPSSKRIWKTQEDLWVMEALLRIIAQTNAAKGADRNSTAAVRVIESLEVGQLAAQASRTPGRIAILPPAGAEVGMMGEGGEGGRGGFGYESMEAGRGDGGRGGEFGYSEGRGGEYGGRGGMPGGAADDATLFDGRYLGDDGKPIVSAGETGPDVYGAQFKRLPIRMQLVMDQRWIPQLIAECANAPLQVEVEEVRINVGEGGGMGGYRGGRGGGNYGGVSGEPMTPDAEPNIKGVVIQGIIYIFNPPDVQPAAGQVANLE